MRPCCYFEVATTESSKHSNKLTSDTLVFEVIDTGKGGSCPLHKQSPV